MLFGFISFWQLLILAILFSLPAGILFIVTQKPSTELLQPMRLHKGARSP